MKPSSCWTVLLSLTACLAFGFAAPAATTDLFSEAVDTGGPFPELGPKIERSIRSGGLRGARVGVLVIDLSTGETLYERSADELFVPASVTKVVTSAAALKLLKPQYKFQTGLYGVGERVGRAWRGDVYLKASGDPSLVGERVWSLVRELHEKGIERIEGALIVDDSFFDRERFGHDWGPRSRAWYHAPHGAVSVNFNCLPVGGRYRAIADDPSLNAGQYFVDMMASQGIELRGALETSAPPMPKDATPLVVSESKPLRTIVADLNKVSNNFIAEQLLKTIGAEVYAPPGTARKGLDAVQSYLRSIGVGDESYALWDGSGLSRSNRISPRAIVQVLDSVARDFEVGPELLASLKVVGVEGGKSRFQDELCLRRMRVKTGHLYGVSTLAGFAETAGGRRLVFAVLANEYRRGRQRADLAIERICEAFLGIDAPGVAARAETVNSGAKPDATTVAGAPVVGPEPARSASAPAGD